jgi:hypothetical protein
MNLLNDKLFDNNQTHSTLKTYATLTIESIEGNRHFTTVNIYRKGAAKINCLIMNIPGIVCKMPCIFK